MLLSLKSESWSEFIINMMLIFNSLLKRSSLWMMSICVMIQSNLIYVILGM